MKTLPVTAVEYQALTKRNPRSRVVVTALLSVLLIATIISFGGQYTPSGVLKLTGHGSPAPIEAAITIIAEYEDATAAADQQQQQYSTTSTTTVTSNAAAEEEEVLTQYTPLQDFETLSDYDDDGVYYSTLAEAQAAAASTPAAAADSAAEVPVTVVAGAAKLSSSSSSSSRSFNPVAADYQAVDSLGGVMQQYNALARYNAEALADADEAAAVDSSSSSSSSQWAASLPAATATASAVDDSHKAQITAADVGLSEQSEQTQTYQPLADIEQQPLWSDPDYEEQMYLQQETAESLEQPIPADALMLSQAAEQLGLAQEAALQQATLDESALQYGALQAALQQEQPAWLQAYNEAVRQREAEQQYTTAAAAGAGAAAAVFEPDWQQQQQNAYEYETDAEEDADAFWDESEDAEVVQEAFSLPQEEQLQLQPQQQQQQQQDATTTSGSSSTGSSSSNSQIRDGWQYHHIFKGQPGTLDKCPAAWLIPDLWVEPRVGSSSNSAGQMLPFTAEVQRKIWEHQHPADCSKAKFLLYIPNNPIGIGSVIHHMSTALQAALDSGRVLAEIPGANFLTWDQHCPKDQRTLGSCYFVPLTNCSVTNDMLLQAELLDTRTRRSLQRLLNRDPSLPQYVKAAYDLTYKYPNKKRVPVMFHQLMEASMIPTERRYYWWRAQSTAYTVRPNERTLAELQRRKSLLFRGNPLQPSCISAFVRHGDKGTEATVFTDSAYEQAVLKLREVDSSLSRQIFLSTEDPATVQYFTDASRGWDTSYVDMPRKPDTSISNAEYMQRHGYAEEMLNGLLNLDLALDCDGFVSSIASNWARLIDELRSTVRCKAGAVHVDADPRFSPLFMSYGMRRL